MTSEAPEDSTVENSTASMAPPSRRQHQDAATLDIAIDYGTSTGSVTFRLKPPGGGESEPFAVEFDKNRYHFPMCAGWVDGVFVWGAELESKLRNNKVDEECAIRYAKLVVYESHQTAEMVTDANAQLARMDKDLADLYAAHLGSIYTFAVDYAKRHYGEEVSAGIDAMEKRVLLSVPQMWTPSCCKKMTDAAKNAGLPTTGLVSEQICELAHLLSGLIANQTYEQNARWKMRDLDLEAGNVVLVADVGGGTVDLACGELIGNLKDGAKASIRIVGEPKGVLAGSEFVTQNFLAWLFADKCQSVRDTGGIRQAMRRLDLSEYALKAKAARLFNQEKVKNPDERDIVSSVIIRSKNGKTLVVDIPHTEMESFFRPVVDDIIDAIEHQIQTDAKTQQTKVIFVPGGFGRSPYLIQRLMKKYEPRNIKVFEGLRRDDQAYNPVPYGALMRYKDVVAHGVPQEYSFGVGQIEEFNAAIHPDAVLVQVGNMDEDGMIADKPIPDYAIVKADPTDEELDIVEERWVTLRQKGRNKPADPAWQMQYLPRGSTPLKVKVYWTTETMRAHAPIKDAADNLLGHIRVWDELEINLDPAKHGYKLQYCEDLGRKVYEVYWRILLTSIGPNVQMKWQIVKPGKHPFDSEGKKQKNRRTTVRSVAEEHILNISTIGHSPFRVE